MMSKSTSLNGEEAGPDDRIYQTQSGKMYIDTDEFVASDEGQQLINQFLESTEEESGQDKISKTDKAMDMLTEVGKAQ